MGDRVTTHPPLDAWARQRALCEVARIALELPDEDELLVRLGRLTAEQREVVARGMEGVRASAERDGFGPG